MHHQLDGGPVGPAQVSHGRNKMPWRTAEPAPWRFESGLRVTAEQPHGYEDWLSTRRTHAREYKSGVWAAKMHPQWRPEDRGHKGIRPYLMMRPSTDYLV